MIQPGTEGKGGRKIHGQGLETHLRLEPLVRFIIITILMFIYK